MVSLALSLVSSCGGVGTDGVYPSPEGLYARMDEKNLERRNMGLAEGALNRRGTEPGADYRLGTEDLIEVDVFQADELKRAVRVSSKGFINLPLAGKIEAAGLTPGELEAEISQRLAKYMEEPVVSVFVREFRGQPVTVLGEVKNPQVYYISGGKRLLEVLSMAGGLTEDAGSLCYVQRAPDASAQGQTVVVDFEELLIKGDAELNVPVRAGDVVNVPKGGVFFVDGAVENPASFRLRGKTTVTQALSMARGLKFEAARSELRIYRDNQRGQRDIISVDYDSILAGESPDIFVRDKDIIIVPKSGIKNFFSVFVNTLRGFISFGKNI